MSDLYYIADPTLSPKAVVQDSRARAEQMKDDKGKSTKKHTFPLSQHSEEPIKNTCSYSLGTHAKEVVSLAFPPR